MVQEALNLNLPHKLIDKARLTFKDALGNLFDCANEVSSFVPAYDGNVPA
jgi:hypothetical protein